MTKALTFIPAYSEFDSNILRDEYHKLVSQEFKPEMIVEYFEGWGKYESNDYVLNDLISIYFSSFKYHIYNNGTDDFIRIPKTLNDFISDTQRIGIQLNWKEEIVKKFK